MKPISKYMKISNGTIHYFDLGEEQKNNLPILFLHGWGMQAQTFLPSMEILSSNRRVIVPDLPGFGKSKCDIKNWTYDEFSNIIIEFIDKLNVTELILMGHSLGAGTCINISIKRSGVKKNILIDSAGAPFRSFWNLVLKRWWKFSDQLVLQSILTPKYNNLLVKTFLYNLFFNFSNCLKALNMPLNCELETAARQIKIPTFIVWAEKDRTTPLELGIELSKQISGSHLEILKGNYFHEWSIVFPEKFAEITNSYLT